MSFINDDRQLDAMATAERTALEEPAVKEKEKKKKLTAAEKKERELKQEQEFKMLEMREQLRREYEMSKKTARKYRERWEAMCREVKLKEMKEELHEWENKVNRVIKQKDAKIQRILDEIATTEEIRQKSFSNHLKLMDYLMDVWKSFQETCHTWYEKEVSEILHDFHQNVEENKSNANKLKLQCENMTHAAQLVAEQEILSDYEQFLEKRDDRVNSEIVKRYRLRDAILEKMTKQREQLLEFYSSIVNVSLDPQKYERINLLMERQRNFLAESLKLDKKEAHCTRIYADLQRELLQEEKEAKRKLNDLNLEYEYFMTKRKNVENEMKLNSEETREKLKIVTSETFKLIKKFQNLRKYGELLLSLAANCRKFQTQSEKVVAWGDFQEPRKDVADVSESLKLKLIDLKSHLDVSEEELQNNAELMSNFWRRQAIVEAQVLLLEEEKKRLLKENQHYIDTIKRLSKTDNAENLTEMLLVKTALK